MMEAYKAAQGQQALGESMMMPEYVQNSGALGALAMIAQAAAGHKLAKDATKTATERASEIFAEEQRREQEKAAAQAKAAEAAQARTWAREDQRDAAKAERERALVQMRIDEANRRAELGARSRIEAAAIAARGQGQGGGAAVLTPDEVKAMGLTPGTVAQRDRNGKISIVQAPQAAGENPKAVAANVMFEALDNLEQGFKSGRYNTGPLEGRLGGVTGDSDLQVMDSDIATVVSALRAIQRVPGSGAESDKELELLLNQAPTRLTDEPAALEIISRLRRKANQYSGAFGGQPAAPAAAPSSVDALLEKYR